MKVIALSCFFFVLTISIGNVTNSYAKGGGYLVIVNAKNPIDSLTKAEVAGYFLKETVAWAGTGDKVFPIDLPMSNKMRGRFSQEVLGKKVQQIGSFWNKQRAKGMKKPKSVKTDKKMVLKIGTFKGGIGYVKAGTKLTKKVKVITVN